MHITGPEVRVSGLVGYRNSYRQSNDTGSLHPPNDVRTGRVSSNAKLRVSLIIRTKHLVEVKKTARRFVVLRKR